MDAKTLANCAERCGGPRRGGSGTMRRATSSLPSYDSPRPSSKKRLMTKISGPKGSVTAIKGGL